VARKINEIIVHAAATDPKWMSGSTAEAKRDEIDRWHKNNGWSGIGYHAIIDRDGSVALGRSEDKIGAHVKGRNRHSLGVCLIGGKGGKRSQKFSDNFTEAQDKTLRKMIADWEKKYPTITKVSGHNEYSPKDCPCFDTTTWLKTKPVAAKLSLWQLILKLFRRLT